MRVIFTKPIMALFMAVFVLSACSTNDLFSKLVKNRKPNGEVTVETAVTADDDKSKLGETTSAKPTNLGRVTVADASKVTESELKVASAKPVSASSQSLGRTVVSLGLLDEAGFWVQTPLVSAEIEGRVVYSDTGKAVNVRLIPNGAPSGSGSQISIATMQFLGIAITDLVEVEVFTR